MLSRPGLRGAPCPNASCGTERRRDHALKATDASGGKPSIRSGDLVAKRLEAADIGPAAASWSPGLEWMHQPNTRPGTRSDASAQGRSSQLEPTLILRGSPS